MKKLYGIPIGIFPSYDMLFNITTATEQGWDKAKSSDSALVFSTAEELEEQITSLLGEETTENLKKYYDSEFFASHVLFVDLVAKPDGNDYENIICEVSQDKTGTLQITYQRELCNGFHSKSIDLLLVALPKSQWNGKAPVWNSKTLDTSSCQTFSGTKYSSSYQKRLESCIEQPSGNGADIGAGL